MGPVFLVSPHLRGSPRHRHFASALGPADQQACKRGARHCYMLQPAHCILGYMHTQCCAYKHYMLPHKGQAWRDTHACPGSSANKISTASINQLLRSPSVGCSVWRTVCVRHSRWRRSRTILASHRQGRPLAHGSLRGCLLETPRRPALQPFQPHGRANSGIPSVHNAQDAGRHGHGRGVGVTWNAAVSMLYSVPRYVYTHRRASLGTANGHFLLDRQVPISAKTAAQSTNNYGPRLPGCQAASHSQAWNPHSSRNHGNPHCKLNQSTCSVHGCKISRVCDKTACRSSTGLRLAGHNQMAICDYTYPGFRPAGLALETRRLPVEVRLLLLCVTAIPAPSNPPLPIAHRTKRTGATNGACPRWTTRRHKVARWPRVLCPSNPSGPDYLSPVLTGARRSHTTIITLNPASHGPPSPRSCCAQQ